MSGLSPGVSTTERTHVRPSTAGSNTVVADVDAAQRVSRVDRDVLTRFATGCLALGLTVDDVLPLDIGVLPKTSSGKLQRAKTRELYETGDLESRGSARKLDPVDAVKEVVKSQIGYFRHAILGGIAGRKDE